MPFIPHTLEDERKMLASIGVDTIEDLFDEIPSALRAGELNQTPEGLNEMQLMRLMAERAALERDR